jgi:hypothetical protein
MLRCGRSWRLLSYWQLLELLDVCRDEVRIACALPICDRVRVVLFNVPVAAVPPERTRALVEEGEADWGLLLNVPEAARVAVDARAFVEKVKADCCACSLVNGDGRRSCCGCG